VAWTFYSSSTPHRQGKGGGGGKILGERRRKTRPSYAYALWFGKKEKKKTREKEEGKKGLEGSALASSPLALSYCWRKKEEKRKGRGGRKERREKKEEVTYLVTSCTTHLTLSPIWLERREKTGGEKGREGKGGRNGTIPFNTPYVLWNLLPGAPPGRTGGREVRSEKRKGRLLYEREPKYALPCFLFFFFVARPSRFRGEKGGKGKASWKKRGRGKGTDCTPLIIYHSLPTPYFRSGRDKKKIDGEGKKKKKKEKKRGVPRGFDFQLLPL